MANVNAIYGPGTPLPLPKGKGEDRGDPKRLWRGVDKTNGFLMRNVDGRVPALKESYSRVDISAESVLSAYNVVPFGHGLWKDAETIVSGPGIVRSDKPARGVLVGINEFNQGWQTGHPVQNWGTPGFGRADMIRKGYVGYKVAMAAAGLDAAYHEYLQRKNVVDADVITTYEDWVSLIEGGADGTKLALFFSNASGAPIFKAIAPVQRETAVPASKGSFIVRVSDERETDEQNAEISIDADTYTYTHDGLAYSCVLADAVQISLYGYVDLTFTAANAGAPEDMPSGAIEIIDITDDDDVVCTVTSVTAGTDEEHVPNGIFDYSPGLAGATFAGYVEIFEPENEAVYVAFNL